MIYFDFRIPYARANDRGEARRAIVTYAKHPKEFRIEEHEESPTVRKIVTVYQNGIWIELGFVTIRFKWNTEV